MPNNIALLKAQYNIIMTMVDKKTALPIKRYVEELELDVEGLELELDEARVRIGELNLRLDIAQGSKNAQAR